MQYTITIDVPEGDTIDDIDIKAAFGVARAELTRLRATELAAYEVRARARGPIMGTVSLSDVWKVGSLLPRDHIKARTLRPLGETRREGS